MSVNKSGTDFFITLQQENVELLINIIYNHTYNNYALKGRIK